MRRSSRKKRFFMINLGLASLVILLLDRVDFPQAEPKISYYRIHDLGLHKLPNALNDNGQVAGTMDVGKDSVQAFVWSLDSGFEYIADDKSIANGINALGDVVGHSGVRPGERSAFRWRKDEGAAPLNDEFKTEALAYAINSKGRVVGQVAVEEGKTLFQGFVYDRSRDAIQYLGTLGGSSSQAAAVNDAGQVAGWARTKGDKSAVAFLWNEKSGLAELGTLGGKNSYANALNEEGATVGSSETQAGAFHAFLYSGERMTDLGTLGGNWSLACDLNDSGLVVGQSDIPQPQPSLFEEKGRELLRKFVNLGSRETAFHACLWTKGTIVDLNDLVGDLGNWEVLSGATTINSKGQIAGYGLKEGRIHGFLLTPNQDLPQSAAGKGQLAWAVEAS
jgi:probable HAF family extracellular repeat protein